MTMNEKVYFLKNKTPEDRFKNIDSTFMDMTYQFELSKQQYKTHFTVPAEWDWRWRQKSFLEVQNR